MRRRLQSVHCIALTDIINGLIATLKPQSNGPSYSNTEVGTLAVDGMGCYI